MGLFWRVWLVLFSCGCRLLVYRQPFIDWVSYCERGKKWLRIITVWWKKIRWQQFSYSMLFLKRWSWPQLINHTLFRLARIHYLFIGLSLSHRNMFQRFSAGGKGGVWESGWTVARCCYNGIPLGDSTLPSSVAIWQGTGLAVLLQKYLEMFNLSGVQSSAHYLTKTIVASQKIIIINLISALHGE